MPKTLVLFQSPHPNVVTLVEAAREGARSVRFAEVDVRRVGAPSDAATAESATRTYRALEHVDDVAAYDGLLVVLSSAPAESGAVLSAIAGAGGSLRDRVGAVVSAAAGASRAQLLWSALGAMADREMILVPAPFGDTTEPPAEAARRLGQRVAETVGWVTHARSHHHHHHHEDQHHDHHSHHHHH